MRAAVFLALIACVPHPGGQCNSDAAIPVTRLLWRSDAGRGLPIRSSPALDGARVYLGTDNGRVTAIDRATGVEVWSYSMRGPVSSSPVRGELLYAASEAGEVAAI